MAHWSTDVSAGRAVQDASSQGRLRPPVQHHFDVHNINNDDVFIMHVVQTLLTILDNLVDGGQIENLETEEGQTETENTAGGALSIKDQSSSNH